jgi:hypothetical protein
MVHILSGNRGSRFSNARILFSRDLRYPDGQNDDGARSFATCPCRRTVPISPRRILSSRLRDPWCQFSTLPLTSSRDAMCHLSSTLTLVVPQRLRHCRDFRRCTDLLPCVLLDGRSRFPPGFQDFRRPVSLDLENFDSPNADIPILRWIPVTFPPNGRSRLCQGFRPVCPRCLCPQEC